MFKMIGDVVPGDIIVDGRKEIPVKEVELDPCGASKVHINGDTCWEGANVVYTKRSN